MKTLIVYYSMGGFTKSIAKKLAEKTGADLLGLHPVKAYPDSGAKRFLVGGRAAIAGEEPKLQPYTFNAEKYGRIVICSPVWASTFTPPVKSFLSAHRDEIRGKKLCAVFTLLGSGAQKAEKKLLAFIGADAFEHSEAIFEPNKKDSHPENEAKLGEICGWFEND